MIEAHKKEVKIKGVNFKFEAWTLKDSFNEEVKYLWGMAIGDLLQKLDFLRIGLKKWAG